ncbi:MAG: GDP-fucose synthetase [Micavibrio sp.]|nr:GDP-fucose synthetase [Micavibrio sp.]HCK32402.1 GDP-fucose synthetase [Rhodospirillaceae bacterium]|tara:strand:+ start:1184 stop:2101 length:918 start_codon:yes stop_codon:yes gene_type:complete
MRVLLTGGYGMLGQALRRLCPDDVELIYFSSAEIDLRDQNAVYQLFKQDYFDAVIHAAAKVGGIQANIDDQPGFLSENLLINTHVIKGAHDAGIRSLINIGSSCMYPKDLGKLLSEEDLLSAPLEPTNEGYALAKLSAAKLCTYIDQQEGFNYKTFIPCNLYGPYDTFNARNSHLIPAVLMKLHQAKEEGGSEVEIWGDGTPRREFVYVDDLANFILSQIKNLEDIPSIMNVGAGEDISINDVYKTAAEIVGYEGAFIHNLDAPMGMKRKLMDISRAQSFGWSPEVSLEEGLEQAYSWYLSHIVM